MAFKKLGFRFETALNMVYVHTNIKYSLLHSADVQHQISPNAQGANA